MQNYRRFDVDGRVIDVRLLFLKQFAFIEVTLDGIAILLSDEQFSKSDVSNITGLLPWNVTLDSLVHPLNVDVLL